MMTTRTAAPSEAPPEQPPRPYRPNYRRIHAKPLPLATFPLPPLIPHNPLSLLHISYVYLSHLIFPPISHVANSVHGYFSPETNSVHITDAVSIRLLWERGFFGKGSLSRSEPTWLDREKKRVGLLAKDTSEEYTNQRREERRRMKMERARKERENIEEKLIQERGRVPDEDAQWSRGAADAIEAVNAPPEYMITDPGNEAIHVEIPSDSPTSVSGSPSLEAVVAESFANPMSNGAAFSTEDITNNPAFEIRNEEHLQLNAEEAFFLSYALGILQIHDSHSKHFIPTPEILALFRSHSHFPPLPSSSLTPFDPFLLSYAAYHHFRSLGWVVRPGIKFAVDWLLYLRGPTFAHAEFAVMVLPAFRDAYWWKDARRSETAKLEKRDWWWLHCLQRVQAQVRKGLILCWVEVPSPEAIAQALVSEKEKEAAETKRIAVDSIDVGKLLKQYKVRDMIIKRWIPNRSRD